MPRRAPTVPLPFSSDRSRGRSAAVVAITTSTSSVSNLNPSQHRHERWHGRGTAVTGHRLSKSHGRDMARARQEHGRLCVNPP
ncbi:hypothetical protein J6590_070157 [Homalodisca vitripennis]|nr:hypothetical protein J6590_070157 [Homalodisca vitripennis]